MPLLPIPIDHQRHFPKTRPNQRLDPSMCPVLVVEKVHVGFTRKHGACEQGKALAAGVGVELDGRGAMDVWFTVLGDGWSTCVWGE